MTAIDAAYALCRWVHFCTLMLAFGWLGFMTWACPATLRPTFDRPVIRTATAGIGLAVLLSTLLLPVLHGARILDDFQAGWTAQTLGGVLLDTGWGHAWLAHAMGVLVLAAAMVTTAFSADRHPQWQTLAAAFALGTLGLTGHAASASGPQAVLWGVNAALHLLSSGFWLGSLLAVPACLRQLTAPELSTAATQALIRFSTLGHGAVALSMLSGSLNAYLILGPRWPIHANAYVLLLAVKIMLILAMVFIALYNRYVLVPRARADIKRLARLMKRTTLIETALGAIALALVSLFASMDPGR